MAGANPQHDVDPLRGTGCRVAVAQGAAMVRAARRLFEEYAASLPESAQISLRHQGFEAEMDALPGKYAEPGGCMLLAERGAGEYVGVVALRALAPGAVHEGEPTPACEMKRMYVRPEARGSGAGRALADALLREARARGYKLMKLDTEPDFVPAVTLYRSLGFRDAPRYNDDPVSCTLWMAKEL